MDTREHDNRTPCKRCLAATLVFVFVLILTAPTWHACEDHPRCNSTLVCGEQHCTCLLERTVIRYYKCCGWGNLECAFTRYVAERTSRRVRDYYSDVACLSAPIRRTPTYDVHVRVHSSVTPSANRGTECLHHLDQLAHDRHDIFVDLTRSNVLWGEDVPIIVDTMILPRWTPSGIRSYFGGMCRLANYTNLFGHHALDLVFIRRGPVASSGRRRVEKVRKRLI